MRTPLYDNRLKVLDLIKCGKQFSFPVARHSNKSSNEIKVTDKECKCKIYKVKWREKEDELKYRDLTGVIYSFLFFFNYDMEP